MTTRNRRPMQTPFLPGSKWCRAVNDCCVVPASLGVSWRASWVNRIRHGRSSLLKTLRNMSRYARLLGLSKHRAQSRSSGAIHRYARVSSRISTPSRKATLCTFTSQLTGSRLTCAVASRHSKREQLLGVTPPNLPKPGQMPRPMTKQQRYEFRRALAKKRNAVVREEKASLKVEMAVSCLSVWTLSPSAATSGPPLAPPFFSARAAADTTAAGGLGRRPQRRCGGRHGSSSCRLGHGSAAPAQANGRPRSPPTRLGSASAVRQAFLAGVSTLRSICTAPHSPGSLP